MADIKQMSFMLLVLLVSVSALYETMLSEDDSENYIFPSVANDLGIATIEDFSSTSLVNDLNSFQIATNKIFTTNVLTEFSAFLNALSEIWGSVWGIFMKLMLLGLFSLIVFYKEIKVILHYNK